MNGKELYNLCEHKKWDQVREYLLHSPDTNQIKKKNIQWRHNHGYNCCDWNSLQKACSNDPPVDIIQLMLEICTQSILFETDKYVQTPLHFACSWNASYQVVKLLVDVGGKTILMIQNEDGWTALHIACFHHENPQEIIKLFVTVGRKNLIEIENDEGETAMDLNNGFYRDLIECTLKETSNALDASHSSHGFLEPQAAVIEDEAENDEPKMRQVISSLSFGELEQDIENDADISIEESSSSTNISAAKIIHMPDTLPDDAHLFAKITFKWKHRIQGIFMSRELWDSQTFLEAIRKCRILPAKKHHEERLFIVQSIGFPLTKQHAASFTTRQVFEMAGLGYGDNLMIEIVVQAIVNEVIELSDDEDVHTSKIRREEKVPKVQPQSPPSRQSPRIVMDQKMQELEEMRIEFTHSPTRGRILLPDDEDTDDGWC